MNTDDGNYNTNNAMTVINFTRNLLLLYYVRYKIINFS